jgi:acyl-CoA synthetase (AMP-forming)/AMP-acid ligase II
VLTSPNDADTPSATDVIKKEILDSCRSALAAHKVPASIRIVPSLEVTPSGKMVRANA